MPDIELFVNGQIYSGWKEASITRSLDAISGKFELRSVDRWETSMQRWTIFPGNECILKLNGIPMITGYVDKAAPSYDAASHEIQISGRDKTGDLVDCSVVGISELHGLKLDGIIRAIIKPFGISLKVESDAGATFPVHAVQPGESAWECIERAAKQRQAVITTDGGGNLVLAAIGNALALDALVEGRNIKSASTDYDHSNRFSEYIVKGQASATGDGWEEAKTSVVQRAKDANIKRYRPKILNAECSSTDGGAETRADLEAAVQAGKSTKATITVQGWKMSNGELWPVNALVGVKSPYLSLDEDLLISETKFSISDRGGQITELTLKRPDAYLLGQGKGKKDRNEKTKKKGVSSDPWDSYTGGGDDS